MVCPRAYEPTLNFFVQVLDATDSNDTHWIIRVARVAKIDALSEEEVLSWSRDKVRREAEMMEWMFASIPVPQVVTVDGSTRAVYRYREMFWKYTR